MEVGKTAHLNHLLNFVSTGVTELQRAEAKSLRIHEGVYINKLYIDQIYIYSIHRHVN